MALPTINQLHDRVRRGMSDWPAFDACLAQVGNTGTTVAVGLTVGNSVKIGQRIQIDQESLLVTSATSTTATCLRAWDGTTAATHVISTPILIAPRFSSQQVIEALSDANRALWPYWFKWISDETITITNQLQADYALPAGFGTSGIVTDAEVLFPGLTNDGWRPYRRFKHTEGGATFTRAINLMTVPPVGSVLRLKGIAPYVGELVAGGTLDTTLLDSAVPALVMYACHLLSSAGETQRLNNSTAVNIGSSSSAPGQNQANSQYHLQRFQQYVATHGQRYPRWRTRRSF